MQVTVLVTVPATEWANSFKFIMDFEQVAGPLALTTATASKLVPTSQADALVTRLITAAITIMVPRLQAS